MFDNGSSLVYNHWPFQEPSDWRYLPYIRLIFQDYVRGYTPKIWPGKWYSTTILGSWNSNWTMNPLGLRWWIGWIVSFPTLFRVSVSLLQPIRFWLVVWNIFLFCHILGIMMPTDEHIFQRGSNHQPVLFAPKKAEECGQIKLDSTDFRRRIGWAIQTLRNAEACRSNRSN